MTEQHEKYANELEKALAQFSENVNKIVTEMFSFEGKKEKDWKMKCPYKYGDNHYCIQSSGDVFLDSWKDIEADNSFFNQGNIFPTREAAELEAKRRNLLTRFRAFRDECNGDWKANWTDDREPLFYIFYDYESGKMKTFADCNAERNFHTFGYFKYDSDCRRAIDLFGDEIEELFVDCEAQ